MKYRCLILLAFFVSVISQSATAHHAVSATFIPNSEITVDGVVTRFSFRNPHVSIHFDVTNSDGSITNWVTESSAATSLQRVGWSKDSLNIGDKIRVIGDSTRDGSPMISSDNVSILNLDGSIAQTLGMGVSDQGFVASNVQANFSDEEATRGPGGVNDPRGIRSEVIKGDERPLTLENGKPNLSAFWDGFGAPYYSPRDPEVSFTEAGAALQAEFSVTNDPQVFCDTPSLIRQAAMTPHPVRITQYEDRVVFEYEEYGVRNEIYFDNRHHKSAPSHFGDSTARYEGQTLIVETKNLLPNLSTAEGNRLTDQTSVTQYYRRIDSEEYGSMLLIRTEVKDPLYLAESLILENVKMARVDRDFVDVECSAPLRKRVEVHAATSFFVTPITLHDFKTIEEADMHCETTAKSVNQDEKIWRAYPNNKFTDVISMADRIGNGPWYNSEGILIARTLEELHSKNANLTNESILTERTDQLNIHEDTQYSISDSLSDELLYCFVKGNYYQPAFIEN